jgi:hypothetical protein
MKIEQRDIRTIRWMIKDSKTKVFNLCTCSHTCVWLSIVMLKERISHVRKFFEIILPASPLFHSNAPELMVVPVGINSQVQGIVQASHYENMQPNDDYTLLSINNFHLSMNVNWRRLFFPVSNTNTACCFICIDVLMLHFAVFTSTIQNPLKAKAYISATRGGKC